MKTKIILGMMILALLAQTVSAATITIDTKYSFGLGERVSFNYSITGAGETVKYVASVNCPQAPMPLLELKEGATPITGTYEFISAVTSNIEPQTCTAIVSIIEPIEQTEQKTFRITTDQALSYDVNTCRDAACLGRTKVFVKGQDIYLSYVSSTSGIAVTGTLTYPDSTMQQITFPASIKADQIGTYQLDASAAMAGFMTTSKSVQFAVIEQEADIQTMQTNEIGALACNSNGLCDAGENYINCPSDCPSLGVEEANYNTAITAITIIILGVASGVLYLFKFRKPKKGKK